MKIEKDSAVRFHYSVYDKAAYEKGEAPFESSKDRQPLAVLIGYGNVIPGLERAMLDKQAGDHFEVDVEAKDAYGDYQDNLTQRIPKKIFGHSRVEAGMQAMMQTNQGARLVTITKVGHTVVDVDLNHPMAGRDLHFDVEIVEVREATPEEIAHGHIHGEGGHQH